MIIFAAAVLWVLGGIVTQALRIQAVYEVIMRETSWDGCDFVAFAWRYTWADVLLGPLLLTRNVNVWGSALGSFYVQLVDDD